MMPCSSLQKLELQISELPASYTVGSILLDTEDLKLALTQECQIWKRAFGAALNRRASADMKHVFSFVDSMMKRLQRPITDLEDVRGAMAALREVRVRDIVPGRNGYLFTYTIADGHVYNRLFIHTFFDKIQSYALLMSREMIREVHYIMEV